MIYWNHQTVIDAVLGAAITAALWLAPAFGAPALLTADASTLTMAARTWLAPALTLLGMMSATTAFIFTVVDRTEFTVLRKSKSESQLWRIFSENLLWLGIAAGYCAIATFWSGDGLAVVAALGTFLATMAAISVTKFIWIMRQIISVRIARGASSERDDA